MEILVWSGHTQGNHWRAITGLHSEQIFVESAQYPWSLTTYLWAWHSLGTRNLYNSKKMTPGSRYKQVFEKVCEFVAIYWEICQTCCKAQRRFHYYKGQVPCTGPGSIFKWLRNGWQPSLVVWGCPWLVGWGWSLAWGSSMLSLVGSKFLLLLCGRVSRLRGHASPSWGCVYFVLNSFWCWFGWPSVSKEEEKKWWCHPRNEWCHTLWVIRYHTLWRSLVMKVIITLTFDIWFAHDGKHYGLEEQYGL